MGASSFQLPVSSFQPPAHPPAEEEGMQAHDESKFGQVPI